MAVIVIFSGSYCRAEEVAKMVAQRLGYRWIGEEFSGHLIPRDITHVLRVCIVASQEYRAALPMRSEGISAKEAQRIITRDDNECREWTKYLFDLGPWNMSLYDIKIPMHEGSVEKAGEMICDNVAKEALQTTPGSQQAAGDVVRGAGRDV